MTSSAETTLDLEQLGLLASALAGRQICVQCDAESPYAWTNGTVIYTTDQKNVETQLQEICIQSALLAAGSLNTAIVSRLCRKPAAAKRYLTIESQRALYALRAALPSSAVALIDPRMAKRSDSADVSLELALTDKTIPPPAAVFGTLKPRILLSAARREAAAVDDYQQPPRQQTRQPLEELDDAATQEKDDHDAASSPVGGGGSLGKHLRSLFQSVRRLQEGGSPGADAPSHWSRTGARQRQQRLYTSNQVESVEDAFGQSLGLLYPEWDQSRAAYRPDWCTVQELQPPCDKAASVSWLEGFGLRKPLTQLSLALGRYHRQPQGDDIDIDAAIEARVNALSGHQGEDTVYIESQRHRRDLSVLVLLDISGSAAQPGQNGQSIHQQQRNLAAALMTVLYEIGDRVALYAFHSQGRGAVHLLPVKKFDDHLSNAVMDRLHSLKPGAYSRLGAAVRHGTSQLIDSGGTPRKLLVVLSDGLAYDHGYEPAYGAADARQALAEARRDGVGCLCLSVGANTDTPVLKRVFGSAAHATIPDLNRIGQLIGPLFRAALRAAEVTRNVGKVA